MLSFRALCSILEKATNEPKNTLRKYGLTADGLPERPWTPRIPEDTARPDLSGGL
jgi:hypothetical protein